MRHTHPDTRNDSIRKSIWIFKTEFRQRPCNFITPFHWCNHLCRTPRRRYCNWLAILVRKLHIHENRVKWSLALIFSYTFQDLEHSPRAKSSYTQKSKPATTATAVRPAHYFVAKFFAHQNRTLFFWRAARSMFIFNNQLIFSSHLHCSMCVCVWFHWAVTDVSNNSPSQQQKYRLKKNRKKIWKIYVEWWGTDNDDGDDLNEWRKKASNKNRL